MTDRELQDAASATSDRGTKDHSITRDRRDMRPQIDPLAFTPYFEDRLLVRRLPPPDDGRLVVLANAAARGQVGHQIGEVVALASKVNFDVALGDKVLYSRMPVNEFEHKGEAYTFIFEEQSILAVLEP